MKLSKGYRSIDLIQIILILIPIFAGFFLISQYSTNVPYMDQWDNDVRDLIKIIEGNYHFSDLIQVHNDHRPIIPRIICYPIELFSSGNFQLLSYLGLIIHIFSFILFLTFVSELIQNRRHFRLLLIPLSWYWFNLFLVSQFLSGLSVDHALCIFFVILTGLLLHNSKRVDRFFLLSLITSSCSFFSFSAGIFTWVAGLCFLICQNGEQRGRKLIIWIATTLFLFVLNYKILEFSSEGRHGYSGYVTYIENFIHYLPYKLLNFIGSIGTQFSNYSYCSLIAGVLIILLFLLYCYFDQNRKVPETDPFIIYLIIFSVLVCLAITISRSGQGTDFGSPEQILFTTAGRQFPVTFLLIPALVLFFWEAFHAFFEKFKGIGLGYQFESGTESCEKGKNGIIFIALIFLILMILSSVGYGIEGFQKAEHWKSSQSDFYLLNYHHMNDTVLLNFYINAEKVRKTSSLLEKNHLSVFSTLINPVT